jgi:hypothetical protein
MAKIKKYGFVFNLKEWQSHQRAELQAEFVILDECITHFKKRVDGLKQAQDVIWVSVLTESDEEATALIMKYGECEIGIRD